MLWKSNPLPNLFEAGIASQAGNYRVHPLKRQRSIVHRFVEPGERLIVLAKAGVYDRDVEGVPMYSS